MNRRAKSPHDNSVDTGESSREIPVSPTVMRWARESAGLSIDDVARMLGRTRISPDTIRLWEQGSGSPTYEQLEALSYTIYKRPLALFFFPEPPTEPTPSQSFRTLPEEEITAIPPRIRYLIRQAQAMQLNLSELYKGVNPAEQQVVRDLQFDLRTSLLAMANKLREYFGISLRTQLNWPTAETAFKEWREVLFRHGVFVFKEAFGEKSRKKKEQPYSGFCIYHQVFPIIYVNNSDPDTRQLFTLFHELAHLLFGTGGIVTRSDDYISLLSGNDREIEIRCNAFTGTFLVPDEDFDKRLKSARIEDDLSGGIERLAEIYHVSREVILRKLFDRGRVSEKQYSKFVSQWKESGGKRKKKGGGDYYNNQLSYLGPRYTEIVFSNYYEKRISIEQLADFLNIKAKGVPELEIRLYRRRTVV